MFGCLRRQKRGAIALDVGSGGVKLLQLTHSDGHCRVLAAGRGAFEPPPGPDDPHRRRQLAVQAVRELLGTGRFRGRRVVSCLRTDELAVKNVRLPQMPEQELRRAVLWEARERFGFEVHGERLHYLRAGEVRQGGQMRQEVILIAVAPETLAGHLDMLSEMQLSPVHIGAEPVALLRAYRRRLRRAEDESTVSVLVDVGLGGTRVAVARGQQALLIKAIELGGRTFNEAVGQALGLSYAEAAHLRRRRAFRSRPSGEQMPGDQVEWSIFDAVRGSVEALAREISLCLRYCSVTFRGLRPTEITLTGGEAYDPAVAKLLGECLDCRCVVGRPLEGVEISGVDLGEDRRSVLTEWSVATGLALHGLWAGERVGTWSHERDRVPA